MNVTADTISVQFGIGDNVEVKFKGSERIEKFLEESKKFSRQISNFSISSELVSLEDNTVDCSLTFYFDKINNKARLQCYGVAYVAKKSQYIIDWGNGTIKDFQQISLLSNSPNKNELIINLKEDGLVSTWTENTPVEKVEVIGKVELAPSKWNDKNIIIALVGVIVAIMIPLFIWYLSR